MGQRSQIYVKVDNELIIANYYGWNFQERMVSRARYGIEYIEDYIDKPTYFEQDTLRLKISRIFDVNFDYKDVAISSNILKEYEEYGEGDDFEDFVFNQDNNDGMLFVWIDTESKTIKYCFTDYDGEKPLDVESYMVWEDRCTTAPYTDRFDAGELTIYTNNKEYIENHAILMTAEELEAFKAINR